MGKRLGSEGNIWRGMMFEKDIRLKTQDLRYEIQDLRFEIWINWEKIEIERK
jgi:hypothetical protein